KAGKLAVAVEIIDPNGSPAGSLDRPVADGSVETKLEARLPNPKLWSPKSPHLYTARVRLLAEGKQLDVRSPRFGMREFKIDDGKFLLNGKPIFLRGYGDDCIYPNTICPPSDKSEFRRR